MFGLLNVDKPAGLTSRDAVNRVQRLVKPHKVGHAGTLDPLATGVLVVAIGQATRLIEYVQRMSKVYQGTFLLGRTSDTEDIEGQIIELQQPPVPTVAEIQAALPSFTGAIEQRPPAYSALKVAGRRAHELARRGESFELAPRIVQINAIEMVRYQYPELELVVHCGGGTYIRSLGRDIAESLGTGAVMSALRRLAVGPFRECGSLAFDSLTFEEIDRRLLPPVMALGKMLRITLEAHELACLARGQSIASRWCENGTELAALDASGCLAAILTRAGEHLQPTKCFIAV
jgi:tRNA pseudouridine55 synthase